MANEYCSDAQITARMVTDHASLDNSTKRSDELIKPASRWVDSRYPYAGEFAAFVDADTPDPVIQQATIAWALSIAWQIMLNVPDNPQTVFLQALAKELLRVNEETGEALYDTSVSTDPVATGALTRDLNTERDANADLVM